MNPKKKLRSLISRQAFIGRFVKRKAKLELPNKILIGTHHKTGTVWLLSIFATISNEFGLNFYKGKQTNLSVEYDIFFQDHSKFYFDTLDNSVRGLHIIRDPRDVVISGVFYHQKSKEKWLHKPKKKFGGLSYQEKLNSCENLDQKIHMEINRSAKTNINDMITWSYSNPAFYELKYEELIADIDLILFHKIFTFLGFPASTLPTLLEIAYDNSIFSGKLDNSDHIRSGASSQWVKYFKQSHKDRCLELFGDALIRLGYEEDDKWIDG